MVATFPQTPTTSYHDTAIVTLLSMVIRTIHTLLLNKLSLSAFEEVNLCPKGYISISENLDHSNGNIAAHYDDDKEFAEPDANRTVQQCAEICNERWGCTGFEYGNGEDVRGECVTYRYGYRNVKEYENRNHEGSEWYSCVILGKQFV